MCEVHGPASRRPIARWYAVAAAVAAALLLASSSSCSDGAPELPEALEGLAVGAAESRTVDLQSSISVQLAFETQEIALKALSIDTVGARGNVTIEVASLSGTPVRLGPPPAADVHQYMRIAHESLENSSVAAVTIGFEVPLDWIESNGYDETGVALDRYADAWTVLPTRVVGLGPASVRYEAISPGLSLLRDHGRRTRQPLSPADRARSGRDTGDL